ncbi:MAG: iron-sulfur cluster insertion protein ErpA [Chloroflexota bacterium]|jgi:iron-sulfur cluster assembly accessory protein|nr:iron-sulfur cluster insertion protein ErpA [Chloroflexota bacterium]
MIETMTPESMESTDVVMLTPVAGAKVRELLETEGNPDLALRVYVAGGGCSGLQYGMALDDSMLEGDTLIEADGIRVLVDAESLGFIMGAEIDYVDSLMGAGFQVNNPNAVSSCGCGHSFKTADDAGAARACGCH